MVKTLAAAQLAPGTFTLQHVMVPMRDGVALATDVYLPAVGGVRAPRRFPAILERTPYNKDRSADTWIAYYLAHGYACVAQDTRGRYASEGVWHMMTDDVADGYDTARWLVRQPWSDGEFATIGISYPGGTQHALAESNPPGLEAVIPANAVADAGYFGMRNGGAFELRFMNWIFAMTAPAGSREARDPGTRAVLEEAGRNIRQYLQNLPVRAGMTPLRFAPEYENWLVAAMDRGENDTYWKQPGFGVIDQLPRYKDVPVYLVGGWYDSWARQTTMDYVALSAAKRGPIKMIVGPWIHGQYTHQAHGEADFGAAAALDPHALWLRWYDRWLKHAPNGIEHEAPIRLFVMGGGSEARTAEGRHLHGGVWRDEHEWPLARTQWTACYLHAGGLLSLERPREPQSATTYNFDPRDPVPTIGGNISSADGIMLQGAWDQKCGPLVWNCANALPLSTRRDVIVFQTAPLQHDVEVTGPIDVYLWASSSAVDTDFTAKLIDVHPPSADFPAGIDMNLEDGIVRARFRNLIDAAVCKTAGQPCQRAPGQPEAMGSEPAGVELMRPGQIYRFVIQLYPTSNVFKQGHRIRLDISSSNFPRFDVNPNTGEPLNRQRRYVIANNTIYHDASHPSYVVLPIIPPAILTTEAPRHRGRRREHKREHKEEPDPLARQRV